MYIYVVRHAKAGSRSRWDTDDRERPLSKNGIAQSIALGDALGRLEIDRIYSSPFVRCIQTVEPLSARLGVQVVADSQLEEACAWEYALELAEAAAGPTVICSHGDVIGDLMITLERRGVPLDDNRIEKGSVWALRVEDGQVVAGEYSSPPA